MAISVDEKKTILGITAEEFPAEPLLGILESLSPEGRKMAFEDENRKTLLSLGDAFINNKDLSSQIENALERWMETDILETFKVLKQGELEIRGSSLPWFFEPVIMTVHERSNHLTQIKASKFLSKREAANDLSF